MAVGRVCLAILLLAGVCGPTLARGRLQKRMDCCPDGETMQCCPNQSGCSFETCDGSGSLPPPISIAGFVLPVVPRLASPDLSGVSRRLDPAALLRPVLERPDPPPRA